MFNAAAHNRASLTFREFEPDDLLKLELQEAQRFFSTVTSSPEYGQELAAAGKAWTALDNGKPIGCSGVVSQWEGRGVAWALLAPDIGPEKFLIIHGAVRDFLRQAPYHRIEAWADMEFKAGHRWLRMLGFKIEGIMRRFTSDKRDAALYALVNYRGALWNM